MVSWDELMPRLQKLYMEMDAAYRQVAGQAGFSCRGCDGTRCCTVDLTLHTSVEMLDLRRGMAMLGADRRSAVAQRCASVLEAKRLDPAGESYRNSVCVVSSDGLCALYEYRPMICRLAGISYFADRPDGKRLEGPGCSRYEAQIRPLHPDLRIDRTLFYRTLAEIEINVVRLTGQRTQPKTIAETLAAKPGAKEPD